MSQQLQAFLDEWLPVQEKTGVDLHSGDAAAWTSAWSRDEPVSVLGAGVRARVGWPEVLRTITWVAESFTDCVSYEYELASADVHGDLAYTAGFERYTATRLGVGVVTNELRVTQIYRREDGVWKVAHRHADHTMAADPP